MNHGYSRVYTPVLRNPCLFHQNTARFTPAYYPTQQAAASSAINTNHPTPSLYARHNPYAVQSTMPYSPQPYPYYPNSPTSSRLDPSAFPFSSYSVPTFSYAPTVSSNGIAIVLIATLVLVALDLVIVRPQKGRIHVN